MPQSQNRKKSTTKKNKYYLNYILDLLDLIVFKKKENDFKIPISENLERLITKILPKNKIFSK